MTVGRARGMMAGPFQGIALALGGAVILSGNDVAVKFLSGNYPLHEVILIRALVGMTIICLLISRSAAGFRQLRTGRPREHLFRVGLVMLSNVTYFLGLSVLPLADAVALAFVSPLFVTLLSRLLMGEAVGPRRWLAVVVGMAGVIVMMRPGAGSIQPAALLIVTSALCYAGSLLMIRRMRATESAPTLSFYVQVGFILVSSLMGLFVGDGHLVAVDGGALAFLFRPWVWPAMADWPAFLVTGIAVTTGGLMIGQAYRTTEASLVAPLEYAGMPMAILWGAMIFDTRPDAVAWIGIALISWAGLYTVWREAVRRRMEKRG
ncbi:MAG: DMT family transporter [Paracoccaceae bacterium]